MDKLFDHPGFRLIFIDDDGMSLKGPFNDEKYLSSEELFKRKESKEKVQEMGYRCISHLWGTTDKTKDYTWRKEDHKIIGVGWKVEVREEKRERIMQIFNYYRGYFWMDLLCTDQEDVNKPLNIMGDIYRRCGECICLLDTICDIPEFNSEKDMLTDMAKDLEEYMWFCRKLPDKYGGHLRGNSLVDAPIGAYELYLDSLIRAEWFNRVWTWQEAVLPPKLLFCSEQARGYRYDPYDQTFLRTLFPYKDMGYNMDDGFKAVPSGEIFPYPLSSIRTITNLKTEQGDLWENITSAAESNRRCTNEEDFVYGIIGILDITIPKRLTLDDAMIHLEKELWMNGIFIGEKTIPNYAPIPGTLSSLYDKMRLIDGITVLGNIDISTFGSDVETRRENHGRIRYKSKHKPHLDPSTYGHIRYRYATETSFIYLETDKYRFLDILETTRIGRKGCTFESNIRGHEKNEIFEIIDNRVRIIGYIVDRSYKDAHGYTYWKSIWS